MTTTLVSNASPRKTSSHIGAVGAVLRIEGVIRKILYGRGVLHIIEDLDGNQFVVRRKKAMGSGPGVLVALRAEVLEHRVYNGIKQTILSAGAEEIVTEDHAFRREG